MANIEELDKAIGAHGMWKSRLRNAIDTGKIDFSVETIRVDNQCAFGKWIYGPTITAAEKTSNHFRKVKELHAEFHKVAAKIADLALNGHKTEANKLLESGGDYALISSKLTQAMLEWKKVSK